MRGFKSPDHAQRFLHVHGVIQNLFRVGRHHLRAFIIEYCGPELSQSGLR